MTCASRFQAVALNRLQEVFAPQVVGIPPTNAIRDLMLLPDGELRHYGFRGDFRAGAVVNIYLSSRDHGFSWVEHEAPPLCPGATVRSPWSGDWLTVLPRHGKPCIEEYQSIHAACPEPGLWLHRSLQGPDGPFISTKIGDLLPRMLAPRQPLALKSRRRWILPAHATASGDVHCQQPLVLISDDDANTWRMICLPSIPRPETAWPHAGPRWHNCGDEPSVAELSDGRLHMMIRTAHDRYWETFSSDGGETWTTAAPSRFYGTITTPLLFPLSDGRLLAIHNNTTPLPEVNHDTQPGLTPDERSGVWEDVFTNRDAIHAAISEDDGKTWQGFRELHLNDLRNAVDFRSRGGADATVDKSVHQSQAVELPHGKVLLSFGQHAECRRMVIFDPNWLYETDRREDFRFGLGAWSIHQYLKSVSGCFRGFTGHCSVNRRPGAALVPHPDGEMREVLQIARHSDDRLLEEREGAVWNFPAGHSGQLRLRLRLPSGSAGAQIALVDRWFNPTDPVVASFAQFVLRIDALGNIEGQPALLPDCWHWLTIRWDLGRSPVATFQVDEGEVHSVPQLASCVNGISYVHLQSAAASADPHGLLLEIIEKTALSP